MDAYLAIASRREVRDYAQRPIPAEVQRRILEAGRVAGSSRNRQPWRFVATDDRERLDALAGTVFAPANLRALRAGHRGGGDGPLVRLPRRRPKDALAQHCCPDAALPWRPRSRVRAFAGSPALAR